MRTLAMATALLLSSAAQADWPANSEIDPAVLLDVTDAGFESISDSLPVLVPDSIPIDDVYQEGNIADIDLSFLGRVELDWYLRVQNLNLGLNLLNIDITPGDGVLWIDARVELNLNDSSDMAQLVAGGEATWKGPFGITISEDVDLLDCGLYVDPFIVDFSTSIGLDYVDDGSGNKVLDATLGTIVWDWDLDGDSITLDCWIGSVNDFLDSIGINLFDLAIDMLEGEVDNLIADLSGDIETALEEAMSDLSLEQEIAFGEAVIELRIKPSDIEIVPEGMRVFTSGYAGTEPHPCIAENSIFSSLETSSALPRLGETPSGIASPHHIGIYADDDFVNQLLFSAYYGGALCFTLSAGEADLPINTAILGILAPGAFDELFPDPQDLVIQTRPKAPPVAIADGANDINLDVDELGLDFYADLDYRMAIIVGLDLDIDAGVDLNFDEPSGALDILVNLDAEGLAATTRHNELVPERSDEIAASVAGLFDTLVGPLLDGLLGDLSFNLPSIAGVGLQTLEAAPSGPGLDWFGFYANAGTVPYGEGGGIGCNEDGSVGCEGGGGCDDMTEGCDTGAGCTAAALPPRALFFIFSLAGIFLRRRASGPRDLAPSE